MSEKITIVTHNVQERIGQPENRDAIFENIIREMAGRTGLIILSDAFREIPDSVEKSTEALKSFADDNEYNFHIAEYEDAERRVSATQDLSKLKQHVAVLSNINASMETVRLGRRNAIETTFSHEGETIVATAAHFDDRSSQTRDIETEVYISRNQNNPLSLLAGDLNSLHSQDPHARFIRNPLVRTALSTIPASMALS